MRDFLLVGFLFVVVFFSIKKPFIGVSAWIWIALTAPASWTFGFSQQLRLNLTIVVVTAFAYMIYKNKPKFRFTAIHFWVFAFGFWMLISTIFNLQIDSGFVWYKYGEFLKVLALFFFVTITVEKKVHVDTFVWAIVLSISSYAAMEAFKFILSGGGHRIVGKAGIIADRNDLAVAVNMCIPLILYLRNTASNKNIRLGLLVLALLNVLAIVGTYSRGGFVGLAILFVALWLKSNRKLVYSLIAVALLPVLYESAPEDWKQRQSTVETAATEDSSFIGRLWAWKIATLIAADNPLTGGGFKATTDPVLWNTYAPVTPDYGPIETPPIPLDKAPKAAHNIYFQVLSSGGFVGLFLFLAMMLAGFSRSRKNEKIAIKENRLWQSELSSAINLSFVAYGITGLNVSLAYFELIYALLALVIVVSHAVNKEKNGDATSVKC